MLTDDLRSRVLARGAVLGARHDLDLPEHFGDPSAEWRAAHEGCGVAVAFRRLIEARGDDRVPFLHGMVSNDVKGLAVGHGMYAAMLTQQGRVVSDMRIYAEPERLLLDVVAWRAAVLRERLEKYLVADDVELTEPEDDQPLLALEGPMARAVVGEALGCTDLPSATLAHVRTVFEGQALRVVIASERNGPGVLLCGPPTIAAALFEACREAGARPLGMAALDVSRVEAGVPWVGVDMDEDVLLMETGLEQAISFTKGCYLGQEVVERVSARGHVNRYLTGLVLDGEHLPEPRAVVHAGGHDAGYVTSAVRSELLGRPIALAIAQRKYAAPGDRVDVALGGGSVAATVVGLPFAPAASAGGGH